MKIGDFGLATVKSRWSGSGQQYKQVEMEAVINYVIENIHLYSATYWQYFVDGPRGDQDERGQPVHISIRCLCIW